MSRKYILCFSGTGRSIKYTFDNLEKNLVNDISPKQIFLVTENQKYLDELHGHFKKFKNVSMKIVENVASVDKDLTFTDTGLWPERQTQLNYLNFLYKRYSLSKMIQEYNKVENIEDCHFIYSRLDVIYKYPISSMVKKVKVNKKVYLPNFHHWLGGYNDRFALANYKNFIKYLEIYPNLRDYNNDIPIHSESITRLHFVKNNLKLGIIRLPFSRVRENGIIFDDVEQFDQRFIFPLKANKHIYRESTLDSLRLIFNKK